MWGPMGLTSVVRNNITYWYLLDLHGSVLRMVDTSGNIVASYWYDAFGVIKSKTESVTNPYQYLGGFGYQTDPDSGLLQVGLRQYNPETGRWMTEDPIGLAGGENLYAYCGNDPVNAVDPMGLSPDCDDADDIIASYSGPGGLGKALNAAFTQNGSDLVNQDYDRVGLTQEYGKVYPAGRDIAINVAVGVATEGLGAATEALGAAGETTAITDAAETISDSTTATDAAETTADEASSIEDLWYRSSFKTERESIDYHFNNHGTDISSENTVEKYTSDAVEFYNKNKDMGFDWALKDDKGTIGTKIKGNPGGIYTKSGKIVTFWYK